MSASTELVRTTLRLPPLAAAALGPASFMARTPSWTVLRQVRKFHSMHFQCSSAPMSANRPGTAPPAQAKSESGAAPPWTLQAEWRVDAAADGSVRSQANAWRTWEGDWRCVCGQGERVSEGRSGRVEERGGEGLAHLGLGERLVELGLAPRDDGDMCAALGELAGEREAEPFRAAADVAVLQKKEEERGVSSLVAVRAACPGAAQYL